MRLSLQKRLKQSKTTCTSHLGFHSLWMLKQDLKNLSARDRFCFSVTTEKEIGDNLCNVLTYVSPYTQTSSARNVQSNNNGPLALFFIHLFFLNNFMLTFLMYIYNTIFCYISLTSQLTMTISYKLYYLSEQYNI